MTPSTCDECGARTSEVSCAELFDRLLALDHSRQQPWGSLHGPAVACYYAQHPNAPRAPGDRARLMEYLGRFVAGQPPEHPGTITIHDVAVDGWFPADGYPERLERWAQSMLAAWRGGRDHP